MNQRSLDAWSQIAAAARSRAQGAYREALQRAQTANQLAERAREAVQQAATSAPLGETASALARRSEAVARLTIEREGAEVAAASAMARADARRSELRVAATAEKRWERVAERMHLRLRAQLQRRERLETEGAFAARAPERPAEAAR